MNGLSTAYRPEEHEGRVWDRWIGEDAFSADPGRVERGEAEPYSIVIPPPNVTAALHLGHALNNTLQDILVRVSRMRGFETLWMPGTDHAGIATQTVVEKRLLAEEGKRRTDLTREEFVARTQSFKDEFEARITDQLQRLGCSCDWRRQRFTMDEVCARAVREAFFGFFREGLIYRGKRLVNWDPVTQTALADDEVEMQEVSGFFWYLRYPVVDDAGAETGEHVTVATTRPETYLGDTAVAVNPSDPDRARFIGAKVKLPFVGRIIPVIGDSYVVLPDASSSDPKAQFASGFLKVTPAHDPNDWDIGLRHDLPVINVMAPDASISGDHGWDDIGDARHFIGLGRDEARAAVEAAFSEAGLLAEKKPYSHSVGHSYRSHAPIEPYLSDQWYCKVTDERLVGRAQRSLSTDQRRSDTWPAEGDGDGTLLFYPERYARTYETWHDNLRDWCISRQLWWGHRIPVWRPDERLIDTLDPETFGALITQLLAWQSDGAIAIQYRGEHTAIVQPDIDDADLAVLFVCVRDASRSDIVEFLERHGLSQDEDVLDTWFSSALWPMSTMGWPDGARAAEETGIEDFRALLGAFNPTNVLCTAREIITLWVSRMVMFNRFFLGESGQSGPAPYHDVFIHAMIQDGEGRKMSKSLGNGVDPLDIIDTHGADALRFTLAQMTTQTQDVRMPVELDEATGKNTSPKFDAGRNFCNKLWNAARFSGAILGSGEASSAATIDPRSLPLIDRWLLSRVAATIASIDSAVERYLFKDYADATYDLLWRDFCDWYLEGIKPTARERSDQRAVLHAALTTILRLLHPITPFVTEALQEHLGDPAVQIEGLELGRRRDGTSLCVSSWPVADASLRDAEAESRFERIRALVSVIREARAKHQVSPKRKVVLHVSQDLAQEISAGEGLVETLAGLREVVTSAPEGPAVGLTFEAVEHHLSDIADAVDADAERDRLTKQITKLDAQQANLAKRLANPGYVDKAPAHMVQQTRDELARVEADRSAMQAALDRLG